MSVDIPKLVHFIWYGEAIPQKYIDNIRWLAKLVVQNYSFLIFSDLLQDIFMKTIKNIRYDQ